MELVAPQATAVAVAEKEEGGMVGTVALMAEMVVSRVLGELAEDLAEVAMAAVVSRVWAAAVKAVAAMGSEVMVVADMGERSAVAEIVVVTPAVAATEAAGRGGGKEGVVREGVETVAVQTAEDKQEEREAVMAGAVMAGQ